MKIYDVSEVLGASLKTCEKRHSFSKFFYGENTSKILDIYNNLGIKTAALWCWGGGGTGQRRGGGAFAPGGVPAGVGMHSDPPGHRAAEGFCGHCQ